MDTLKRKVFEKCLSVTSSFEGASWGGSNGNFDGMGASAFTLQWNIGQRTLQPLLIAMYQSDLVKFKLIAKDNTQKIIDVCLSSDWDAMQDFVKEINQGDEFVVAPNKEGRHFHGGKHLKSEWTIIFSDLGNNFRDQQMNTAQKYFDDAIQECIAFKLNTERSIAFMFDLCVQRGKGNLSNEQQEFLKVSKLPSYIEDDDTWLKYILDSDTKDTSDRWKTDVYSRRACILNDGGIVHGKDYDLGGEFGLTDNKIL